MTDKAELRQRLREARREHVATLPDSTRALLFRHPPAPLLELVGEGVAIGLYAAAPCEAPTAHYAAFFGERGHPLALPRFAGRGADMEFAAHTDPLGESDLEVGPFGLLQPLAQAETLVPQLLFVPLLGFTASGARIGQGGGHYDRWLAAHPRTLAIGMAWDCQAVPMLPLEPHDRALDAIVTPTRLYGPFS
ncbi:5-formyltetrahydrofolate cyclo-ligase [Leptolyngbya sp. 15MV]|nr:5-formyltetrahydrofolate cyclo-ligase [Leptolyngbya sp. 15MV]